MTWDTATLLLLPIKCKFHPTQQVTDRNYVSVLCSGWAAERHNKRPPSQYSRFWVIMQGTRLYHTQEQISNIYNGKITKKAHSKNHQATRSSILHLLILPSSEGFLASRYKPDQKKSHSAASSLWELMNIRTRGNFREITTWFQNLGQEFFFLEGKEKGWTDMFNQAIGNVRYWPLHSDSTFQSFFEC